jgi:hypothetical protein
MKIASIDRPAPPPPQQSIGNVFAVLIRRDNRHAALLVPGDFVPAGSAINRNAVCKQLHDTYRKLQTPLEARGFGMPKIPDLFSADR